MGPPACRPHGVSRDRRWERGFGEEDATSSSCSGSALMAVSAALGWGSAAAVLDGGTEIVGLQRVLWVWVPGAGAHCHLSSQSLMAASCEISNIFSNYISAMYQPEEVQLPPDVLGRPGEDSGMGLSLSTSQPLAEGTGGMGHSGGGVQWWWNAGGVSSTQGTNEEVLEEHCKDTVPLGRARLVSCLSFSRGTFAGGYPGWHEV